MILTTTIVYLNHFDNAFHFDDSHAILENPNIRDLKNIPSFFKDGTTSSSLPQNQTYRPIVATSLAIDYWLGNGYTPFYFHLSNFVFFLLQGILLFLFIFKILEVSHKNKYNFYIASGSVLFYMLHPVMAETVNYIISRSDIQSTFFVLLAFVLYQYSDFSKKYHIYLIPVFIGMLCKPTAIMFAPLLLCYVLLFESETSFINVFKPAEFKASLTSYKKVIPAFLFCLLLYIFHNKMMPSSYVAGGNSVYHYLITQPSVLAYYFGSLFFPIHLSADTDWLPLTSILSLKFIFGFIFIITLIYIALITSRNKKLLPISFGISWFFITLLPTSSFIPLAEVMNDHRMFYPYVGLVLALGWALGLLFIKLKKGASLTTKTFLIISCLFLCVYAFGTYQRNKVWDTEESLWKDVTIKSPKNGRGLMNYGVIKMGQGAYDEAENYFTKALEYTPKYHFLYINLGILTSAKKENKKAKNYFEQAITYGGNFYNSWYYYADFLYKTSQKKQALIKVKKAHELAPYHMETRFLLMKIYEENEDWASLNQLATSTLNIDSNDTRVKHYLESSINKVSKIVLTERLIEKDPTSEKYLNLSLQYYQKKQYLKSIEIAKKALIINPSYPDALNNICAAYNCIGEYDKAIEFCNKALKVQSNFPLAKNNLKHATGQRATILKMTALIKTHPEEKNYLNLSMLYHNNGLYEKCIAIAKKGLIKHPNSDNLYNNICAAYNSQKKWKEAVKAGKKGLKINPKNQLLKNNYNYSLSNIN